MRLSLVPQDASFLQGNLCDYLQECSIDQSRCLSILRNLGFEREQFDLPMQQYSQGQKKKVLIAKSLCEQAHLYLWDEPLNYIDIFYASSWSSWWQILKEPCCSSSMTDAPFAGRLRPIQ